MRVTNNMISSRVIFNLGRSLDRYLKLETMMSTGRRINVPSDDPIGTQKDLRYRTSLAEIEQYQRNIGTGLHRLTDYDGTLGEMATAVNSAYELAVSLSNSTYDASAREIAANDARSLLEQVLSLGNTQNEGRYILAGYKSRVKPFASSIYGVEYAGDAGRVEIEVEAGTRVMVNLIGSDVLMTPTSILGGNGDLQSGIDGTTLLSDLNLGNGVDLSTGIIRVTDNNTGTTVNVDISAAVTVDDMITAVNTQLAAGGIPNADISLGFGVAGNNLEWSITDSGLITGVTALNNLNQGSGVDLATGKIVIRNADDSIHVEVDLTSASTIDDVIQAINNTLDAHPDPQVHNIDAAINAGGTGIDIVDSNGVALGLMIEEFSINGTTAADLGILGSIDPTLNGSDLNPQSDYSVVENAPGETTAADLGIGGNFHDTSVGTSIQPSLEAGTPLSLLCGGNGLPLGQIRISHGNDSVLLDLGNPVLSTVGDVINAINNTGLGITASINDDLTGIQVVSNETGKTLVITEVDGGHTAHDLGIFGSPDILGSIIILEQALREDDQEVILQIIGNLRDGHQELLRHRGGVGSKVVRLESTNTRLMDLHFSFTKMLSDVEDADLTKLVSDLSMQENSYRAALIASSKILQPTLLDFLR